MGCQWKTAGRALLLAAGLWSGLAGWAVAVTVHDDLGNRIELAAPARRIVSLAPHLTEMLFAAGAGNQVRGAVSYSDYPEAAREIERVGSYNRLDIERIVMMRPDLVVAWASGNPRQQVDAVRAMGIPVYFSQPLALPGIAETLRDLGQLSGHVESAEQAAATFENKLQLLKEQYAGRAVVSVFYEVWHQPLRTVGGAHPISEVIRLCGGRNLFEEQTRLAPVVSLESVLLGDPAVILASGMGEERPEWLEQWRQWPGLQAVRHEFLYFVPPDLIQRHAPRILQGAAMICQQLQQVREELGCQSSEPCLPH